MKSRRSLLEKVPPGGAPSKVDARPGVACRRSRSRTAFSHWSLLSRTKREYTGAPFNFTSSGVPTVLAAPPAATPEAPLDPAPVAPAPSVPPPLGVAPPSTLAVQPQSAAKTQLIDKPRSAGPRPSRACLKREAGVARPSDTSFAAAPAVFLSVAFIQTSRPRYDQWHQLDQPVS